MPFGKKGPRQTNGARKIPGVKLRPAPAKDPHAPSTSRQAGRDDDNKPTRRRLLDEDDDDADEKDVNGASAQDFQMREKKPLEGCRLCIRLGMGQDDRFDELKRDAFELGALAAERKLLTSTTHLVVELPLTSRAEEYYQAAAKNGTRIVVPEWVTALKTAWKAAENIVLDQYEQKYRVLPLEGITIAPLGFSKEQYIEEELRDNGANVKPVGSEGVAVVLVASNTARKNPELQRAVSERNKAVAHNRSLPEKDKQALMPEFNIVWEGWAREAINVGVRRTDRTAVWRWKESSSEPDIPYDRPVLVEINIPETAAPLRKRGTSSPGVATVAKRAKRTAADDVTSFLREHKESTTTETSRKEAGQQPSALASICGPRANAFVPTSTPAPGRANFKLPQPERSFAEADATLTRGKGKPKAAESQGLGRVFDGLSIKVVYRGDRRSVIERALIQHGARLVASESKADFIVVAALHCAQGYARSDDTRIVTENWIEACLMHERVVDPDFFLAKPLPYDCKPFTGSSDIKVGLSGFEEPELSHIRRFGTALGIEIDATFSKQKTHLMHAAVDKKEAVEGIKAQRARDWNRPIVGVEWLHHLAMANLMDETAPATESIVDTIAQIVEQPAEEPANEAIPAAPPVEEEPAEDAASPQPEDLASPVKDAPDELQAPNYVPAMSPVKLNSPAREPTAPPSSPPRAPSVSRGDGFAVPHKPRGRVMPDALAALQQAAARPRSNKLRKRSSASSATSASTPKAQGNLELLDAPRRVPGAGPEFQPTQKSQFEEPESLLVYYEDAAVAAARQKRMMLKAAAAAAAAAEAEAAASKAAPETGSRRRSTRLI